MLKRFSGLALIALALGVLLSCSRSTNFASTNTMYVVTQSSAQIWGYRADFNSGTLSNINGSPFVAEPASAILIDPSKTFAYVANNNPLPNSTNPDGTPANTILRFSFDLNGSLIPVSGGPVSTGGTNSVALAMDPGGKFLFVANQGNCTALPCPTGTQPSTISVFAVGSGAALTAVPGSPFIVGFPLNVPVANPNPAAVALAVHPSLSLLYVADQNDGYVLMYPFDPNTGVLPTSSTNPSQAIASQATLVGSVPSSIAINPAGSYLYVANAGSNNISGFCIDISVPCPNANNQNFPPGTLVAMNGSPFVAELGPVSIAVDPSGQFVYAVDQGSNQVSGYRINLTTGDLTPTLGSPYNSGAGPIAIAISPINKFLYVSDNAAATISGFILDPHAGNLAAVSQAVTTGTQPAGIAFGK